MTTRLIVALNSQNIIGQNGSLPWSYPGDLKFFREKTVGHVVIMGRNTWESLPPQVRPLKGRINLVVSSTLAPVPGVVYASLPLALDAASTWDDKDVWIIGGAKLYEAAIDSIDEAVITHIPDKVDVQKGSCVYWQQPSSLVLSRSEPHPYCPDLTVSYWSKKT